MTGLPGDYGGVYQPSPAQRVGQRIDQALIPTGIGTYLGAWRGRGDWANTTDEFRRRKGHDALTALDALITELTGCREELAATLAGYGDDAPPPER